MGVASPSRHESCKQPKLNGCKKSRLCNPVVASHPKLLGSDSQPDIHNILTTQYRAMRKNALEYTSLL